MKIQTAAFGLVAGLCCVFVGCASLETSDAGKREYDSKCADCHGPGGKGDGPQASILPKQPANLTLLAKKNGGVFPALRVHEIIDGRLEVMSHGPRTMPVWGDELLAKAAERPQDSSPEAITFGESRVTGQINALVNYLSKLQEK